MEGGSAFPMKITGVFIMDNGVAISKWLISKSCLILCEGKLTCAGKNSPGRLTQVQAVLACFSFCCARKKSLMLCGFPPPGHAGLPKQ